ncbi:hypothetical protein ACFC1T_32385 [Kitasatospora sp. NPDC056076]|uniref:hypothetical protein n=1 Tax=Kitasatospora sp. NPDC056076 TaxID=3345703 RepID=UPI0035E0153D
MQRPITVKSSLALAAAALTVGVVAALSMPAVADTQPQAGTHRSTRAANVPDVEFDYTGSDTLSGTPKLGVPYGNRAKVKDVNGNQVGTAYGNCVKDQVGSTQDQHLCSTVIKYDDGKQIALTSVRPIAHAGAALQEFDAIVTGGTLAYEGLTGTARFTPRSAEVYEVSFS